MMFVAVLIMVISRRYNIKFFLFNCFMICLFFSLHIKFYNYNVLSVGVVEISEVFENYSIVKDQRYEYLIYNGENDFVRGNSILFKGELVDIRNTFNDFNNYLNKKGINYEIDYYEYEIIDDSIYLNDKIVDSLLENKDEYNSSFLKLILFNEKDRFNKEFYNSFSVFSLTYLIAVSGFHINLFLKILKKILKKDVFCYGGILFYLFLLDFSVSSYRAFLCNLFKKINKKIEFDLNNLDIVSLIGVVFMFINPGVIFSFGFIFSFLSSFVLEIFTLYSKRKLVLGFYVYLVNIPIILFYYYELNVLTLGLSIIMSYPISFLYVFSLIYLFLDKFYLVYKLVINMLLNIFNALGKFDCSIIFGKPSYIFLIVYYFLLLCFFLFKEKNSKIKYVYISLVFACLTFQYFKPCLNVNEQFYFINVGQGDCIAFTIPGSKNVVLLDTGGNKYKDVASKEIIPFLKSIGVNKIEKIIITHDDFDHNGSLQSLISNFDVGEVVDYYIKDVMIGTSRFINLNNNIGRDNEGSMVLYGNYGGYDLLLMGDASIDIEKNILKDVDNVDVLKIAHHGSNTSSGEKFLSKIKGDVAIISVGENNSYGHPHDEVIERLYKYGYVVLRTDKNNDIGFLKNIFGFSYIDYFD